MLGTSGLFISIIRVFPDLVTPRVRTLSQWTEKPVSQEDTRSISEIKLQVTNSIHTCKKNVQVWSHHYGAAVGWLSSWVSTLRWLTSSHTFRFGVFGVWSTCFLRGPVIPFHLSFGGGTGCLGLRTHLYELSNWKRCFPQVLRFVSNSTKQTNWMFFPPSILDLFGRCWNYCCHGFLVAFQV